MKSAIVTALFAYLAIAGFVLVLLVGYSAGKRQPHQPVTAQEAIAHVLVAVAWGYYIPHAIYQVYQGDKSLNAEGSES